MSDKKDVYANGRMAMENQHKDVFDYGSIGGAANQRRADQVDSMTYSVEPKSMSLPDCLFALSQRVEYLKKQLADKTAMESELNSIELMLNALKAPR